MEEGLEEKRVHVKELQKQSKVSICCTLLIVLTLSKKSVLYSDLEDFYCRNWRMHWSMQRKTLHIVRCSW